MSELEVWGDEEEKKEEERKNERLVGEKNRRRERFWNFIQVGLGGSWVELLLFE